MLCSIVPLSPSVLDLVESAAFTILSRDATLVPFVGSLVLDAQFGTQNACLVLYLFFVADEKHGVYSHETLPVFAGSEAFQLSVSLLEKQNRRQPLHTAMAHALFLLVQRRSCCRSLSWKTKPTTDLHTAMAHVQQGKICIYSVIFAL